jgi:hypothetical protein
VFSFYRTFLTNKNSFIKDQHYVNNKNFFKLTEIFILLKTIVVPNENKRKKMHFSDAHGDWDIYIATNALNSKERN